MEFGIERILSVLNDVLSSPQRSYDVIHVTGTNGKGSVCSILNKILTQISSDSLIVGMFTSPPLVNPGDNIIIQGQSITEECYNELKEKVQQKIKVYNSSVIECKRQLYLTSFELQTVVGLLWFSLNRVRLAIVEVGMGGRFDCTNVFDRSDQVLACIMTSISLEHLNELGPDWMSIIHHKIGIGKPNVPFFVSRQEDILDSDGSILVTSNEIQKYILYEAEIEGCFPVIFCSPCIRKESTIQFKSMINSQIFDISLALNGDMQLYNASVALETINWLYFVFHYMDNYASIDQLLVSIQSGMQLVSWPGRIEWIHSKIESNSVPRIILDGAHNPAGARQLVKYITQQLISRPNINHLHWIFGVSKGKDILQMNRILFSSFHNIIHTVEFSAPPEMPWIKCLSKFELSKSIISSIEKKNDNFDIVCDKLELFELLKQIFDPSSSICQEYHAKEECLFIITGSLYLVRDVYIWIKKCLL